MFELLDVKVDGILNIPQLTIPAGKITVITGPSGSGKSTFLRLLNNLDPADAGTILYKKESILNLEPLSLRRNVVMVPQAPVIFDGTVKDNLEIGLIFAEKELPSVAEMEKALKLFELDKPLNEEAEHLSGGEKQRLALARAVLLDPEVYLLDEPTSALDEETAESVMSSFCAYARKQAKTVIMVTHSKEIAELAAENEIEIKGGVVHG
ncbi:ABC transporter ATP-binding protein [Bacillus sp. REN3]|uniref:ABC transporter ATP-binding protein n=1 Tax=Bacillus sp. REN3 TaxID=2802440 RepID=UPI001AEDB482|nr:ABC transporter ATP-binding protein [Bacillus sp. REN3]